MKVLVTGSSGFIGAHLCAELTRRGHEPVPFDRPARDIRSAADLGWVMAGGDLGAVVNLAGMLGTPELLGAERRGLRGQHPRRGQRLRRGRPARACRWCRSAPGTRGSRTRTRSRRRARKTWGWPARAWLGEKITVVRAYHVYGPGQLPGPPYGPAKVHKFFPTFACSALSGQPLELCGGGGQLIDPVHVSDVAVALADAIGGPYGTGRGGGVREARQRGAGGRGHRRRGRAYAPGG